MLLEVSNLSYSLEHKEVLKNLEMKIQAGQITAVLGANGTGKSTLLRLLAGFLDADSGEIFFQKEKVRGPSQRLIPGQPGISLVRQDNRLFPLHTVRQNIRHILQFKHKEFQEEKIEELAALLSLRENLDRTLKYLSGGEQQRVAIAASLASDPELLLLDEPFSQTDMFLREELKKYLRGIVETLGIGILFVTHDPNDALSLADNIMILDNGEIIEEGTSEELYYTPRNRSTAILTGYCNWIPKGIIPGLNHLHSIKDQYLVRPDKISILPEANNLELKAEVKEEEFSGFFKIIHLVLVESRLPLLVTRISSSPGLKTGEKVRIRFE